MNQGKYIPRIIDPMVERYLATMGAVCIEGPKWCGKTWTSSFHSNSEIMIGNPANQFQNRKLAELSPALVLEGETPRRFRHYGMRFDIQWIKEEPKASLS